MIVLEDTIVLKKSIFELFKDQKDDVILDFNMEQNHTKHIIFHECFQNVTEKIWTGGHSRWDRFWFFVIYLIASPIFWIIYFFNFLFVNVIA
jgi:hypothetical protein